MLINYKNTNFNVDRTSYIELTPIRDDVIKIVFRGLHISTSYDNAGWYQRFYDDGISQRISRYAYIGRYHHFN